MVTAKELSSYKDYGRVLCITNGLIEAYVTLDVGPRIIRFGFVGGQNILRDDRAAFEPRTDERYTALFGKGTKWENLGGHRIWVAPEAYPQTYYPDTRPVEYTLTATGAVFEPTSELEVGLAKELTVSMDAHEASMEVRMSVKNITHHNQEYAVWGLTVCAQGGTAVIPMNTKDTELLPNRLISVWPYTDLSDPRIRFGKEYITVKQDPTVEAPLKLGVDLGEGYVEYHLGDDVFKKQYRTSHDTLYYPDNGCSFETYANDQFIELESLGELKTVKPGESAVLTEIWTIERANG